MILKIELAKDALKYRRVEEKLLDLFKQGKLTGTVHTSIGQEIIPIILNKYLQKDDYKFSNHRGHSHYMAATDDIEGLVKELLGKIDGCSGGYGGSQHLHNKEYNFYSNGIQGGMTPIAAGVAMGLKAENQKKIACVYIGDGTLGQGVLYEAINFCGIFELPVLFVCEDNGVAQSTMTSVFKLECLEERIKGFSLKYMQGDTDDWDSLNEVVSKSIDLVRNNKPVFLRIKTRRLMSHSKGDDNRPQNIVADNFKNDPLGILISSDLDLQKNDAQLAEELDFLVERCLASEDLLNSEIYTYIQIREYNKDYGGAFKVTGKLSDTYSDRVLNTPISEQALIGVATGLSLMGKKSIVEIMFGDFMTLTIDQVYQHISKFSTMYGESVGLPMLIRSPMGGRRGYGPTHSQSIERLFLGIPGVSVSSINKYSPISDIINEGMHKKMPHIMFEHKLIYSSEDVSPCANFYNIFVTDDFSKTVVFSPKSSQPKFTILTYGYGLDIVENLIAETNISVEVICPTIISPFNILPLIKSLVKTGKLFIFEEGYDLFGLSSAVVLELNKHKFVFELIGSCGNGSIIPSSYAAEINLLDSGLERLKEYIKNV